MPGRSLIFRWFHALPLRHKLIGTIVATSALALLLRLVELFGIAPLVLSSRRLQRKLNELGAQAFDLFLNRGAHVVGLHNCPQPPRGGEVPFQVLRLVQFVRGCLQQT